VPLALGAAEGYGGVRDEDVLKEDVVGAGGAHAYGPPVIKDGDTLAVHGDGEVEDRGAVLRVFIDGGGDQEVAGWGATAKDLASGDAEAAVYFGGGAGAIEPIRGAGADEDELLIGDAAEEWLDGVTLAQPPDGGGEEVGVHGEGEGRGAAGASELAEQGAELRMGGATATEGFGHAGGEEAGGLHFRVVFCDEAVFSIMGGGAGSEGRGELVDDGDPTEIRVDSHGYVGIVRSILQRRQR
jgi:hypothetical protein